MKSLFLPRRYLQLADTVSPPAGRSLGPRQWIMGRGLCLYRCFFLGDLPVAERKNALSLRISQWSPFAQTGSYIVRHGESAQVWIWDEAARQALAAQQKVKRAMVIPEAVLLSPGPDGARLLACEQGFEGQIRRHGMLVAARWWPGQPTAQEWDRFLAANDHDPQAAIPQPEASAFLARPWGKPAFSGQSLQVLSEEKWVLVSAAILVFLLTWQLTSIWKWQQGVTKQETRLASLAAEVEPLLQAKGQAMENKAAIERLQSLTPYPSQLELLAAVLENLPKKNVEFMEWHYNSGTLEFILEGENLNPVTYVKMFQANSFFHEVTAEQKQRSNQLIVKMQVTKQ